MFICGRDSQSFEHVLTACVVASGSQCAQSLALTHSNARIDAQDIRSRFGFSTLKTIGADNDALPAFHLALIFVGGLGDFRLNVATFNGLERATTFVNALDVLPRAALDVVC